MTPKEQVLKEHQEALNLWDLIIHEVIMHEPTHFRGLELSEIEPERIIFKKSIKRKLDKKLKDHLSIYGKEPDSFNISRDDYKILISEIRASENAIPSFANITINNYQGVLLNIYG